MANLDDSVIEIVDQDESVIVSETQTNVSVNEIGPSSDPTLSSNLANEMVIQQENAVINLLSPVEANTVSIDASKSVSELENEVARLRNENDDLKAKMCEYGNNSITVLFRNKATFNMYKDKIVKLLGKFVNFNVAMDDSKYKLDVKIDETITPEECQGVDNEVVERAVSPHKKRKKKSKSANADLFVLDTTPSMDSDNQDQLKYNRKFSFTENPEPAKRPKTNLSTCFNCEENHNLKDCPKPKNFSKINSARQKFRSQQSKAVRYHADEERKYEHLRPGKISDKLREALGIRKNDLPHYIYRMRALGYPPGWFSDAQSSENDLVVFDFQTKGAFPEKRKTDIDELKIIEYPGFNVPMEKGVRDEYKAFGCPPYSPHCSKEKTLNLLKQLRREAEDNLEPCNMEIDADKDVESNDNSCEEVNSTSLMELEIQKKLLLAQLEDAANNSFSAEKTDEKPEENRVKSEEIDNCTSTPKKTEEKSFSSNVKTSSFGTPILKTTSPYSSLPKSENFSKNMCDVINFENLPNSTGKYEQMSDVLTKVRNTLRNINGQT